MFSKIPSESNFIGLVSDPSPSQPKSEQLGLPKESYETAEGIHRAAGDVEWWVRPVSPALSPPTSTDIWSISQPNQDKTWFKIYNSQLALDLSQMQSNLKSYPSKRLIWAIINSINSLISALKLQLVHISNGIGHFLWSTIIPEYQLHALTKVGCGFAHVEYSRVLHAQQIIYLVVIFWEAQ